MDIPLFIFVLFALQIICLVAGKFATKNMKTEKDYFLAGKEVKFFPLMMTFIATQVGGGLVLGSAEEAYKYGWAVLLYPMGACLGLLLLASGIGKKLAQFEVSTVAQLFEVVYKSSFLKKVASLLSILSLFMVLVAQVIASKKFMVSLGVTGNELFLVFWGLVVLYTVIGGLKAVVSIDIIQALFFIVVFFAGLGFVLYTQNWTLGEMASTGFLGEHFDFDTTKLSGWLLMPLLFMVIEQDMAQRCFAAKSSKVVTKAAKWSAILTMIICVIPVFFGVLGKSQGIEVIAGSSVFMTVVEALTNPIFTAFIGCAVLMAVISTAISLMNAVSSNVTQDFNLAIFKNIQNVQKSRLITCLIGIGSLFVSFYFTNIVDLMIQSYELSVCCLFVPVFIALFKSSGNKTSAALAIGFGAMGFFLFRFVDIGLPKEIAGVLLSATGYGIGEILACIQSRQRLFYS